MNNNGKPPGAIYSEAAYAQGKMLDHSGWYGVLPKRITPSDIDAVWDNSGDILFGELSSQHETWGELSRGQILTYFNTIGPVSRHFAVLLKHSVFGRQIDTFKDIDSFHLMIRKDRDLLLWPSRDRPCDGSQWVKFVLFWFKNAGAARKWTIERAVASELDIDAVEWLADYERSYVEAHGEAPW
jgi:hypothetical protein